MKSKKLSKQIEKISFGLFKNLTEFTLCFLYTLMTSASAGYGTGKVKATQEKAFEEFSSINWDIEWGKLRRVLQSLKKQGLITYVKNQLKTAQITEIGQKKIKNLLPFYDEKRPWDGRVYLITYDIEEEQRNDRDILRDFVLKKLGAAKLQNSVYLLLYNPREILKDLVKEKGLEGSILVSDMGKDGSIGEETLEELLSRLYKFEELNERYKDFINQFKEKKRSKTEAAFTFYSILQDDPQLPFDLLPDDWVGDKAYQLFKETLIK